MAGADVGASAVGVWLCLYDQYLRVMHTMVFAVRGGVKAGAGAQCRNDVWLLQLASCGFSECRRANGQVAGVGLCIGLLMHSPSSPSCGLGTLPSGNFGIGNVLPCSDQCD